MSDNKLSMFQLYGFQPNHLAFYCASTLRSVARDQVSDQQFQICGVSVDWDYVFVSLAADSKVLMYWCSDNVMRPLRALRHLQSPYVSDVTHVILQNRRVTLFLTKSREVICLKEVKDDWGVSVITGDVTSIASCNVSINEYDMKVVMIQSGELAFLTADHVIHSSLLPSISVCEVSCGTNHMLLLDTRGHVYSCGYGNRGQLGHGDMINRNYPMIIEMTVAIDIIKISAGGWHSALLSSSHDVYTNGWNCDGQLGHNLNVAMVMQPTLVAISDDIEFSVIACGSRHTVAISSSNDIYTWGWNKYNQLQPWKQLAHVIQDVKCGLWNTLYITKCN